MTITAPLFLWAVIILALTSIPGKEMPEINLWNWDKLAHGGVYFILAVLLFRYLYFVRRVALKAVPGPAILIGIVYGLLDELHQLFIPNRSCTWQDMLANTVGICLGVYLASRFYKNQKSKVAR